MAKDNKTKRFRSGNEEQPQKIKPRTIICLIIIIFILFIKAAPDSKINSILGKITGKNTDYVKMFSDIKETVISHTIKGEPYIMPVNGEITSGFGKRQDPISGEEKEHTGIDIAVPENTDVLAAQSGTVTRVEENQFYGKFIMIDHGNNITSLYGHLNEQSVAVGDKVTKKDIIGKSGNTGNSTGGHLHFEIRNNNIPVNPMEFLT